MGKRAQVKIEVDFDKETFTIDWTEEEGAVETFTTLSPLADVLVKSLILANRKAKTYGMAWWSEGYMGNVARVLSKASRIRKMLWRDQPFNDASEPVWDTLMDLINLAGFAVINHREGNKWGGNHA